MCSVGPEVGRGCGGATLGWDPPDVPVDLTYPVTAAQASGGTSPVRVPGHELPPSRLFPSPGASGRTDSSSGQHPAPRSAMAEAREGAPARRRRADGEPFPRAETRRAGETPRRWLRPVSRGSRRGGGLGWPERGRDTSRDGRGGGGYEVGGRGYAGGWVNGALRMEGGVSTHPGNQSVRPSIQAHIHVTNYPVPPLHQSAPGLKLRRFQPSAPAPQSPGCPAGCWGL